ncbi:MAG: heme biosynthesis protein [Desulfobacteraceae bacterium 4572_88]|nr:MAG: heme biosynthesis protein [Desulfobacteraceae bacterium 4572_88]
MTLKKTVSFSKHASNIFFHILTRCNLRCRHCYINPKQHGRNTLPLSVTEAWLSVFAEKNSTANLIFLGGEPTLHPDLASAIKKARKLGFKSVTVDTNGYLFHDILSKVEPGEVDYFSFSLDGPTPETNDRIRGKGTYEKCLGGIRRAIARGFSASMIYTVSRANIQELELMPGLLRNLGISRFFIQVIGIRGKLAASPEKLQLTREEWLSVIPRVAEQVAELGIRVSYPKVFLDPEEPFECAGLVADNYFIFPNGRVYRCPLCEDFPLHSLCFQENRLVRTEKINESDLFELSIPEGCVMNKLIQPENLNSGQGASGKKDLPHSKIACCMLKEDICMD